MKRTVLCAWPKTRELFKRHKKLGYTSIEVQQISVDEYYAARDIKSKYVGNDLLPVSDKRKQEAFDDGIYRVTLYKEKEYPKMTIEVTHVTIGRTPGNPDIVRVHTTLPTSIDGAPDQLPMVFTVARGTAEKYISRFFPTVPVQVIDEELI